MSKCSGPYTVLSQEPRNAGAMPNLKVVPSSALRVPMPYQDPLLTTGFPYADAWLKANGVDICQCRGHILNPCQDDALAVLKSLCMKFQVKSRLRGKVVREQLSKERACCHRLLLW